MYRGAVITDVEPVTHLHAVAVDRYRFPRQGVDDHQWDQLLGELKRTVVVRAVGYQGPKAVGLMVGADQMIAASLAGGIGAVRFVPMVFREGRVVHAQRAIDLVRRYMQESERVRLRGRQAVPMSTGCLQKLEVPTTLVCTKSSGPRIERSTCDSAAK